MKKKKNTTPDEWERRIASILDKSRNSFLDINAKYERRSKLNALCSIENHCGPHQRAAIDAFQATINAPLSRATDDELYRSIESRFCKFVDDKLVAKAKAIDALRDQIEALSDDIRQLRTDSSRMDKAVSHHERCLVELDTWQGNLSNIEVILNEEKIWKARIEAELGTLMQSTRQQQVQISNKADFISLKTSLELAKSETTHSVSSSISALQASMKRDISALKEKMKEEVFINIQPLQANMMETLKIAVEKETNTSIEKELERLQGYIESFNKSKGKVQAFVTSAVETAEKNLKGEIEASLKEVKRLQKDAGQLKRIIRDDVATDLTTLKEEISKLNMKQSEFMPALNSSIESCRSELFEKTKQGFHLIETLIGNRATVVDNALSSNKTQIEDVQTQQRDEASRQAEDMSKLFARVTELEANLLKITRHYPFDENILSAKINSIANEKIERLEGMIKVLESRKSSINIRETEVWREAKKLLAEEENSRRSSIVQLPDELNEERNRTLSEVARKILAVASKRGHDPSLVELAKNMQSGKIATPHPITKRSKEIDASPVSGTSSPESEISISTTEALSLCGVKLDDHTHSPRATKD